MKTPQGSDIDKSIFLKKINNISDDEKQDIIQSLRAVVEFCKSKSEESYVKIREVELNKDLKTCSIGTNSFKQIFKKIVNSESTIWVVDSSPEGPCGIVQLSRFEASEKRGSDILFWRYIAKKAITNPNGDQLFPGFKCTDYDEAEYTYDWKDEKYRKLYCDYIEFSPF